MTKVLRALRNWSIALAVCFGASPFVLAQDASPQARQAGPAEALYLQLSSVDLDASRVFRVRDASLDRASIHITLDDGNIAFTKDVLGRITGAFFEGDGELLLVPPDEVERQSMSLFTGMAVLEERFSTAYLRFNDDTALELQPSLRQSQDAEDFVSRYNQTAHNLAQEDGMRLLASFTEMLPISGGTNGPANTRSPDPEDRLLHARLQGNTLGVFDVFFDSTAAEQVEAGQAKRTENGGVFYDVWTSFPTAHAAPSRAAEKDIPETLPPETESHEDPVLVRRYVIDAHVKPPKELDAAVSLELEVKRGGLRFLVFELSRFLNVKSVEADGRPVEFIHNPAVEGTRLARSENDLVAVILPQPATKGQKIKLHFVYGGEVLAEAGKGLLYVGARGTWYPNRGMAMADFDLTFHYPAGWTLLATGKPQPDSSGATGTNDRDSEQMTRWISERPLPVAGFNLGKYVRGAAQAGNIAVETYATAGVERDFPKAQAQVMRVVPNPQPQPLPQVQQVLVAPSVPSPARNATIVAENAARAIRYYAERFGPFPYSQLALTQMPGLESQGWPGLIFLSSYAFLTQQERADLHMNALQNLEDQLIPAHEAAHQWWGDLITWSTYHDQWFSEGLANYSALMLLQESNPTGFRQMMEKYRQDLATENKNGNFVKDAGAVTLGNRLLSSHFPQGYVAISYGRATWLFHMLRSMLDEGQESSNGKIASDKIEPDPFVRALLKLRERYAGTAISTRELLNVFAEDLPPDLRYEGKASLDWFLDGWVNGTSLPRLELQNVKFTAGDSSTVASGSIRQKEAPENLVTSVPIFAVVGQKKLVRVGRVFADGAETSFRLSVPLGTHKLLLDPYGTVLTAPK